jgi:hypothetical protein
VNLTIHLHLLPALRVREDLRSIHPYAFTVRCLDTWTNVAYAFRSATEISGTLDIKRLGDGCEQLMCGGYRFYLGVSLCLSDSATVRGQAHLSNVDHSYLF